VSIKITFILGRISDGDFDTLEQGDIVSAKMILTDDDYALFRYNDGDSIQVETGNGNRLWCAILHLETILEKDKNLLMFTLRKSAN
jgi:hypothetical protein